MLLESVISFLLTASCPAEGAAGVPVSVQWTPTYAPADTTVAEERNDTLGGVWIPDQVGNDALGTVGNAVESGAVHFRWNKYRYESSYLDNAEAAARIRQMLDEIGYEHVDSVIVTAYASPEGVYEHNQMLCRKRAKEFDKVVKKELGLAADGLNLIVRPGGEAWALLRERIEADENVSDIARERILRLLDNDKIGWDTKKWRMENGWLGSTRKEGDLYRWLLVNHYRYLRAIAVDIHVSNALVAIDEQGIDVVPEEPTEIPDHIGDDTTGVGDDAATVTPSTDRDSSDSTLTVFDEPVVLTDEVPEAGVDVNQAIDYEPIERLADIVLKPFKVAYEQLCKLATRRIGVEIPDQAVGDTTAVTPDSTAGPFWPVFGLGTNLLYDATYIPGYGFTSIPSGTIEYYPENGHYTIGADVEWPNWRHEDQHRFFQIHNITLWGRYYFNPEQYRFNGWYLSGGANGAAFGVGWNKKGWQGEGLGISVGGGHKWTFGRIYIDAGLSLGVFYSRFDSFTWGNDATGWYYYDYVGAPEDFEPRLKRWLWIGPTRLQVTLGVDLFNRNRKKN